MNDDKQLSDDELFMSDETVETQETAVEIETPETPEIQEASPEVETQQAEPVPVEEPETEKSEETPEDPAGESGAQVPSWRLREINEAKAAAEKQAEDARQEKARLEAELQQMKQQIAQQQQPPKTIPDVFEDPDGFREYQQNQVAQLQNQLRANAAQNQAYAQHGFDTVETAWKAADQAAITDQALQARIINSPNPWAEAVAWHKNQEIQKQIGEGGIDGFREREREALMQDPEFRKSVFEAMQKEAGLGAVEKTTTTAIPSLNGAARVATPSNGDPIMSDKELFNLV